MDFPIERAQQLYELITDIKFRPIEAKEDRKFLAWVFDKYRESSVVAQKDDLSNALFKYLRERKINDVLE